MAQKFRLYRPPRPAIFSVRFWSRVTFVGMLIAVLFGSYQNQFGELFATYTPPPRKPPTVVYPGSAPAGPSIVKLDANRSASQPASAGGGLKIVQPEPTATGTLNGQKLPTVVKLGPGAGGVSAGSLRPKSIEVVDGDTVRADGQSYRLSGIDTPESGPLAKCTAERDLAARASRRLREIVAGGELRLDRTSCGCAAGTEGTPACNHGRLCGVLSVSGRDVGQILIGEGLAKKYDCALGHCPPKQPWC